jgi:soluble lytic murein transglycosylase
VNRAFPALASLALGIAALSPVTACAQSDADFLAAKSAYERNDARRLDALLPALSGHVLEAYAQAWRLRIGLEGADPAVVRAYLSRHGGTPPAEQLRVEWLRTLGVRANWPLFAQELPLAQVDDVEVACHAIQHRRLVDGEAALVAAKPLYATGRSTPDACEPLFAALFASGSLTPADRQARFRLAIEAGNTRLAHLVAATAPPPHRIADGELARVDRDPVGALAKGNFAWRQASGRELALYALDRAARRDAIAARAAWVKWRVQLPPDDRQWGNARLAFHGARQLHPDANAWFGEAGDVALPEETREWRVRAALRAQSWHDVRAAIDAMPGPQRDEAAWRYWRARALAALGQREQSNALYADLAREYHFYALLAAEALGTSIAPTSEPVATTDAVLAGFGARADVKRAVKLAQLDMRIESAREWLPIVRGFSDEGLLIASEFARREGLVDRSINLAERTVARHDFAMRYQTPYRAEFEAAGREHDMDTAMLFGIARQESRFAPDIVSSAGAQGLMQLMPATARWVAKQLGDSAYQPSRITDVDLNTRFGAFYFRHCLDRLDGHPALAAAAYNAGPGRAQAWRPALPLEGAAWVETIPFNETRDYVKKVLANAMFYTRALGRPAVPLTARLSTVAPRSPASGALATAN